MNVNQTGGNLFNSSQLLNSFYNKGKSASTQGMVEVAPGYYCQNDPKIIANFKKNFDSEGNHIGPNGLAGLDATGKEPSEWQQIIEISDEQKQALFDMVKSEFVQNNGVADGDTTRRSEVYNSYYKTIAVDDRLKANWTMQQYESACRSAIDSVVKAADPNWKNGDSFDAGILENIDWNDIGVLTGDSASKGLDKYI